MKNENINYRSLLRGADLSIYDENKLPELLKKVRGGDKDAIEKMILGHMRLAISIVNRYHLTFIYYVDILDSAAMEGVVVAVNQIAKGKMENHNNVTGYIVKYIHQYIVDAINRRNVISTPRKKKDSLIEPLYDNNLLKKDGRVARCAGANQLQEFEIWDIIENLTNIELERKILKLKMASYNDEEIGKLVGLSRLQVFRVRHKLLKRYQRREK